VKVLLLPAVKDIGPDAAYDLGVKEVAIELILTVGGDVVGPFGGDSAITVDPIRCPAVLEIALGLLWGSHPAVHR